MIICVLLIMSVSLLCGCNKFMKLLDPYYMYGTTHKLSGAFIDSEDIKDVAKTLTDFNYYNYIIIEMPENSHITDTKYYLTSYMKNDDITDSKSNYYAVLLKYEDDNGDPIIIVLNYDLSTAINPTYTSTEKKYADDVYEITTDFYFRNYYNYTNIKNFEDEKSATKLTAMSWYTLDYWVRVVPKYPATGFVKDFYFSDKYSSNGYNLYNYGDKTTHDIDRTHYIYPNDYSIPTHGIISIYDNRNLTDEERDELHLGIIKSIQENSYLYCRVVSHKQGKF